MLKRFVAAMLAGLMVFAPVLALAQNINPSTQLRFVAPPVAYSVVLTGTTATGAWNAAAGPGTAGVPFVSNGAGVLPSFGGTNTFIFDKGSNGDAAVFGTNVKAYLQSTGGQWSLTHATAGGGSGVLGGAGTMSALVNGNAVFTCGVSTCTFLDSITPQDGNGIFGTTSNTNANVGYWGEYLTYTLAAGSAVSMTTSTPRNIISGSYTAGDWDISGMLNCFYGLTTNVTFVGGGVSTTSATFGADNTFTARTYGTGGAVMGNAITTRDVLPTVRVSLAATTTVYLVASGTFTASTMDCHGQLRGRRVR